MFNTFTRRRAGYYLAGAAMLFSTAFLWQSAARAGQAAIQEIAPASIAVVNIDLIFKLAELKERELTLRSRQTDRQNQINSLQDQIKQIRIDIDELDLTRDELNEKLIRGMELEGQLDGFVKAAQGAMNAETNHLAGEMYNKMITTIDRVANRMNIDLVLVDDTSLKPPQALSGRRILYRNDRLDISLIVLNEMNAAYAAGVNP